MIAVLVAVFVLSGAAGLIYESLWSRYLGLFVGHSAYAQIIVLVIFLGGMSLGAHLVGRWTDRIRRPLVGYAVVELIVGVLAIVFHDVFLAATDFAYASIFPAFSGFLLTAVKWAIAGLLILPQSILLGATFPLMSSGVIRLARNRVSPGRILSLLYFSNSLGAAIGVLVAGLWLIAKVGLPGVLLIAGFINVLIAAFVFLLARAHERLRALDAQTNERSEFGAGGLASGASASVGNPELQTPNAQRLTFVLLSVAFGTAVASFIYEIAWIRMLSLVLGSATHSFELMLSAFILGLSLGAFWIRTRADTLDNPLRLLGMVQWMMGLLAIATLPVYLMSFDWMATVLGTVASNENGYRVFTVFRYGVALLIMLPATFCAGMTLPLITRILMKSVGERAIGSVYAINTLGSILGVIIAGLLLMPLVGLKRLLILGALIDIGLGMWLLSQAPEPPSATTADKPKRRRWQSESPLTIPLLTTAFLIATITIVSRFDIAVITSGVYRHGVVGRGTSSAFPYYKDGRTATVSVERNVSGFITLATNGKPDASVDPAWRDTSEKASRAPLQLTRDLATQYMLPLITLAHHPRAEQAAVIGQGSGITSHVLLGSPYLKDLATIEIEPEMIEGSRFFMPINRRVFEDGRSHFVIDDAKSYFASSGRKFDLIISEPSNPWVSGVSGLFTQEFYARVKAQLADDGVFGQWLHLYEINDGLVNSVIAAIDTVFPAYEVFFTSDADIIIVAAKHRVPAPTWTIVTYPDIADDMKRVVPLRPSWFEALRLAGRDVLHPMLKLHAEPNSDFFPVLDLNAERMRFMHENASGYTGLAEGRFDLVAALSGRRLGFGVGSASPTPEIDRSQAHALSARLHAVRTGTDSLAKAVAVDEELSTARLRVEQLEAAATNRKAPASWHSWMDAVVEADDDLHGGTAGVVDSTFFRTMRAYAIQQKAPMQARVALDFLEGIGAWNWPQAAQSARVLMLVKDPIPWIPDVLFRNGAAAAFIMTRDTASAKKVVKDYANRADDRFRERLLGSILVQIDSTFRKEMGW